MAERDPVKVWSARLRASGVDVPELITNAVMQALYRQTAQNQQQQHIVAHLGRHFIAQQLCSANDSPQHQG